MEHEVSTVFMNDSDLPGLFTDRDCSSGKEVAHEVVVELPRMSTNEADAVRSVRPKGKNC